MKSAITTADRTADWMVRVILGLNMLFLGSFLAVALMATLRQ